MSFISIKILHSICQYQKKVNKTKMSFFILFVREREHPNSILKWKSKKHQPKKRLTGDGLRVPDKVAGGPSAATPCEFLHSLKI